MTKATTRDDQALNLFTRHPAAVGETYWQHLAVAGSFWFWLTLAALAAFVHAIVPALCETTASQIIRKLHAKMETRH